MPINWWQFGHLGWRDQARIDELRRRQRRLSPFPSLPPPGFLGEPSEEVRPPGFLGEAAGFRPRPASADEALFAQLVGRTQIGPFNPLAEVAPLVPGVTRPYPFGTVDPQEVAMRPLRAVGETLAGRPGNIPGVLGAPFTAEPRGEYPSEVEATGQDVFAKYFWRKAAESRARRGLPPVEPLTPQKLIAAQPEPLRTAWGLGGLSIDMILDPLNLAFIGGPQAVKAAAGMLGRGLEKRAVLKALEAEFKTVKAFTQLPQAKQQELLRYGVRGATGKGPKVPKFESPLVKKRELLDQALDDWASERAYMDNAGNYHLKTPGKESGPIAPWNKVVKETFTGETVAERNHLFHWTAMQRKGLDVQGRPLAPKPPVAPVGVEAAKPIKEYGGLRVYAVPGKEGMYIVTGQTPKGPVTYWTSRIPTGSDLAKVTKRGGLALSKQLKPWQFPGGGLSKVERQLARKQIRQMLKEVGPIEPLPLPPAVAEAERLYGVGKKPPVAPAEAKVAAAAPEAVPSEAEFTAADNALISQIRTAFVETKNPSEVLIVLPDGTALGGREGVGIGAFQHLAEDLPPVGQWLEAGVIRTTWEEGGTFLVEIHRPITTQQFKTLSRTMEGAKSVLVDFSIAGQPLKTIEGTSNIVRSQLRKLVETKPSAAGPEVAPVKIPLMITRKMEQDLGGLGFSEEQIAKMTPEEAWGHLKGKPPIEAPLITAEAAIPGAGKPPIEPPPTGIGTPVEPPLDPKAVVKEWTDQIRAAKKLRGPTAEAISKERGIRKAIIERQLQAKRGPEARQAAFGAAKGEIPTPEFEPASKVFSQEKAELLQEMIRGHFEDDAYRFLPAQTAFDKLFSGGRIPSRSELTVLEEVFGADFVKAVLSQRTTSAKAWELFLEAWNIPKALKASYDLSATLRQGAFLLMEGNPAKQAFIAELKAARSEAGFKALNESIVANKWYDFSQGLGKDSLDLTLPRVARGIVGREEPFIGARLAQKIPIIGRGVRISERAYTGFLNKIRMDVFAKEAEKLTATNAPREAYEKLAWNINILSGRGTLGRFTEASAILNLPFFSPRFATSRFQIPLTFATKNPQLLKMATRDVVGYISSVFAALALLDMSGVAKIEWNPTSSDFGKVRIGKVRLDPFAGFQQPVILVAQILAGKRKRLESGALVEIDPMQRVGQFIETKLAPSASALLSLKRGKLYAGKALTPANALYELLIPIPVTDIWEAAAEGGGIADSIIRGAAGGIPAVMGVGVQTFGIGVDWSKELKDYFNIPTDPIERAEKKIRVDRTEYRVRHPDVDAKLFITGQVGSISNVSEDSPSYRRAERYAIQYILENRINPDDIKGVKEAKEKVARWEKAGIPDPSRVTATDRLVMRLGSQWFQERQRVQPYFDFEVKARKEKLWDGKTVGEVAAIIDGLEGPDDVVKAKTEAILGRYPRLIEIIGEVKAKKKAWRMENPSLEALLQKLDIMPSPQAVPAGVR